MPIKKKEEVIKPEVLSTDISAKTKKKDTKSSKNAVSSGTKRSSSTTKTKTAVGKNSSSAKSTVKKDSDKKTATSTSKKSSSTSKTQTSLKKSRIEVVEYYDLPYRYNQTLVKVLYQTPTTLFIYWDISENERMNFINQYGENFFNDTRPVLVIHNDTMHYSFEIEIDDFANSWYLHINDSNCKYNVELGRRPKYYGENKSIDLPNDYVYVTSSNEIESPNDHVLFNKNIDVVYFKDVKTNIVTAKSVTSLSFLRNMGKLYSLFDLHTNFDEENMPEGKHLQLDLNNPTSGNPTSKFK